MGELSRIGVAIDSALLRKFDRLIRRRRYTNRSEAFRDLIRKELVGEEVAGGSREVVGTLTLVYDHHVRLLNEKLTHLQHHHYEQILSALHLHLDEANCLEVLVLRGSSKQIRKLADTLVSTRGVKHGQLTLTTAGGGI